LEKIRTNQFHDVAEYIKGFCLLLLKKLQIMNNELVMLNNFELKMNVEKDKRTKVKNPKFRFSYSKGDLENVMNSTFMRSEKTLLNLESKMSNSRSFQASDKLKSNEMRLKILNSNENVQGYDFDGFNMESDLENIQRAEEMVRNNLKIAKEEEEKNLLLNADLDNNEISDQNTMDDLNFTGNFKSIFQSSHIDFSRSKSATNL
jgi:hypothetical protein